MGVMVRYPQRFGHMVYFIYSSSIPVLCLGLFVSEGVTGY